MVRKAVTNRGSAGRVQSVATRIVVERERERMAFVAADYWGVDAELAKREGDDRAFGASVVSLDGSKVAVGRDFDADGQPPQRRDRPRRGVLPPAWAPSSARPR